MSIYFDNRYDESEKSTLAKNTSITICLVSSSSNRVLVQSSLLRSNDTPIIVSSTASEVAQATTQTQADKTTRPIMGRKSRVAGERRVKNMQRGEKM